MTNHQTKCEHWQESISLMAAGYLSAEMQKELRQHLADCESCTERYSEIVSICDSLCQIRPVARVHTTSIHNRLRSLKKQKIYGRSAYLKFTACVFLGISFAVFLLTSQIRVPDSQPVIAPTNSIQSVEMKSQMQSTTNLKTEPESISTPEIESDSKFSPAWPLPTLIAYKQALSESDEVLEILMRRHEESIVFKPSDPKSFLKELNP